MYYTTSELEQAIRDLLANHREPEQIQALTGLSLDRCRELSRIYVGVTNRTEPLSPFIAREIEEVPEESKKACLETIRKVYAPGNLKIPAVKYARETLRVGLKAAKEFVELLPEFNSFRDR